MSTADSFSGAGQAGHPRSIASRPRDARDRAAPEAPKASPPSSRSAASGSDERITSRDVLRQLANEAMQYPPPRDMVVLRASASKYLLTSLEPALALGEQIRRELSESHAARADAAVTPDDRRRAADLLDPARSTNR